MKQSFIINGQFLVDPAANLITDSQAGSKHRLESRLMEVLCILIAAPGRTVLREELVEQVWQNYGGGDEGLTQAVSALRKALNDKDKTIIQTIPKKGYLFTGTTADAMQVPARRRSVGKNMILAISAVAAVLLLTVYFLTNVTQRNTPVSQNKQDTRLSIVADVTSQSGASKSVTCYDNKRNSYKWISNGDAQPEFYINNLKIPIGKWESHMVVITYLKHKLQEKMHSK
jgi:DNA-binding winged helix-turn-helix (wHTH) protein